MNLAYTMAPGRGDTDLILFKLAELLAARGFRCSGTVQTNSERGDMGPCDMNVQVLPNGPILRISQNLGRSARGCRLDPAALETAVALVSASIEQGADVLIINKFGKHEAEGRGFRPVIAEALSRGIPVLVGVNSLNLRAFEEFSEGLGSALPCESAALADWLSGLGLSFAETALLPVP
jgi:nucleoside-triphosphatase THEP1